MAEETTQADGFYDTTPAREGTLKNAAAVEGERQNPTAVSKEVLDEMLQTLQAEREGLNQALRSAIFTLDDQIAPNRARITLLESTKKQLEEEQEKIANALERDIGSKETLLTLLTPVFKDGIPETKLEFDDLVKKPGFLPDGAVPDEVVDRGDKYRATIERIEEMQYALNNNNTHIKDVNDQYDAAINRIEETTKKILEPVQQEILANDDRRTELNASSQDDEKKYVYERFANKVNDSDLPAEKKKEAQEFLAEARLESSNSKDFLDKIDEPSSPVRQFIGEEVKVSGTGRINIRVALDGEGNRIATINPAVGNEKIVINLEEQGGTLNLSGIADGRKINVMADKGVQDADLVGTEGKEINFLGPGVESSHVALERVKDKHGRSKMQAKRDEEGNRIVTYKAMPEFDKNANPAEAFNIVGADRNNSDMLAIAGVRAEAREEGKALARENRALQEAQHNQAEKVTLKTENEKLRAALKESGVNLTGRVAGGENIAMTNEHGRFPAPGIAAGNVREPGQSVASVG